MPVRPRAAAPSGPDARKGKKQKVELRIKIPRAPKHARGKALRPFFVATTTLGMKVVVYAHGPHTTALATVLSGLTSANCTPVTGGRMCHVPVAVPVGNDDFVVTTYDKAPSGGSFGTANQLAVGSTTVNVLMGKANAIPLTLGGVVATAGIALSKTSIPVIDSITGPSALTATITGKDADGNTIIGNGWYDATGNSVTMQLSSNQPSVTFSPPPAVVTFAAPTSKVSYYAPQATTAQIQNGFTATITATPSNSGSTAGSSILTLAKPAFTEFTISTMSSGAENIEVGPDGAIWFSNPTSINSAAYCDRCHRWIASDRFRRSLDGCVPARSRQRLGR